MELDLNLFLHSSTDSSDSKIDHNCTIDNILNDSDSSSASPSSSPRSNAKPGAALAAATAASRSVPTPHAAAIKSRRAGIARLRKNLEEEEVMRSSSDTVVDSAIGSNSKELDDKLSEEDDKFDEFQSTTLDTRAENGCVLETEVVSESLGEDNLEHRCNLANFESEASELHLDDKSTILPSVSENNVVENVREIESIEEKVPHSPRLDEEEKMEEEREVSLANVTEDD